MTRFDENSAQRLSRNATGLILPHWLNAVFALLVVLGLIMGQPYAKAQTTEDTQNISAPVLVAYDMRIAGDELRTRVVMEFEQKPEFSYHLLSSPHRVVVDLPETLFGLEEESETSRGLLSDIRFGLMAPGRSRIVFSGIGPMKPELAKVMENGPGDGFRLVFDFVAISDEEFDALIREQDWSGSGLVSGKSARLPETDQEKDHRFTVAIDPGHGGIDTGAKGRKGLQEKDVTLDMGKLLKEALDPFPDIKVVMTRTDDRFVSLSERVRIARQHKADLLVSIHADSIRLRGVRGASVYTLSDKASDELAQQLAISENRSDLLAGLSLQNEPDGVADILIDLTRRETHVFSVSLARFVVDSFRGSIRLINNPIRSAGFKVLRAHDVPSILVELGYLSNREDEELLRDPKWRQQAVDLLATAINAFRQKTGTANN